MIPLINGVSYSWASISVNIMGQPLIGITKISYKEEQEIDPLMGAGNKPIAVGYGDSKMEGSMALYADEVDLLENLSPTGRIQDLPPFAVIISYQAGNKIKTHRLISVIFKTNQRSGSSGDKKLEVELPLFIGDIKWK